MDIIIVGLGSMGKRRIRLLQKIRPNDKLIGVDKNIERRNTAEKEFVIDTEADLEAALSHNVKYAFVCTSPLSHAQIINQCLKKNISVFTEINLVDDLYDENIALAKEHGSVLYLSSTPLFRDEIRYITNRVHDLRDPLNYIYHIGQYLPDWHPWENYKDFFIGDKRTSGCREILAIEFPWLIRCFGEIEDVKVISSRNTRLDIDYQDHYSILTTHSSGHHGVIVADVVCRKAVRYFELFGENIYLTWDGSTEGLREYDAETKSEHTVNLYEQVEHLNGYNPLIIENAYESEILDFFAVAEQGKAPTYSFEQDKEILSWIDRVENNV